MREKHLTQVAKFISTKGVLWNEGKAVALAWFLDDDLIINKGTDDRTRDIIKKANNNRYAIKE